MLLPMKYASVGLLLHWLWVQPSESEATSTMQRLTPKVHVTNVTLSKGQASVDQATSSNATLTTVTPLSTPATPPQPPMSPSSTLVYQYFILLSYFMGQFFLVKLFSTLLVK